nr:MAG TPA: hypothetical protein [Caudoviricetes sp.]
MFFLLPLNANVFIAGCHGGAAVKTKINNNARRIETLNL